MASSCWESASFARGREFEPGLRHKKRPHMEASSMLDKSFCAKPDKWVWPTTINCSCTNSSIQFCLKVSIRIMSCLESFANAFLHWCKHWWSTYKKGRPGGQLLIEWMILSKIGQISLDYDNLSFSDKPTMVSTFGSVNNKFWSSSESMLTENRKSICFKSLPPDAGFASISIFFMKPGICAINFQFTLPQDISIPIHF